MTDNASGLRKLQRLTVLPGMAIDTEDALEFSVLENIRPIIETAPLEQAADDYARMMQGEARFRMLVTKDGLAHSAGVK